MDTSNITLYSCRAPPQDLDGEFSKHPRTEEHTEILAQTSTVTELWRDYGIVLDVIVSYLFVLSVIQKAHVYLQPFTNDFPRADIHELLAPDILHQIIKGAFKDHLVSWVEDFLVLKHGRTRANEILDDIDQRYVLI